MGTLLLFTQPSRKTPWRKVRDFSASEGILHVLCHNVFPKFRLDVFKNSVIVEFGGLFYLQDSAGYKRQLKPSV